MVLAAPGVGRVTWSTATRQAVLRGEHSELLMHP
jgi:hypothetical protein